MKIKIFVFLATFSICSFFCIAKASAISINLDDHSISPSCNLFNIQNCSRSDLIGILIRVILRDYPPFTSISNLKIENVEYQSETENKHINVNYCNTGETIAMSVLDIKITNLRTSQFKTYNGFIPKANECLNAQKLQPVP
ncbi:MAG: hypothetical protein PHY30_02030 [Candidatus Pacebacteria bacterium]|nr:hypothetical protein [Candidatus Paceibacterota bacterium]